MLNDCFLNIVRENKTAKNVELWINEKIEQTIEILSSQKLNLQENGREEFFLTAELSKLVITQSSVII